MFRSKLRQIAMAFTVVIAGALLLGMFHFAQQGIAQDARPRQLRSDAVFVPQVETSYLEVVEGGVTPRVARPTVVYQYQKASDPSFHPADVAPPLTPALPHALEIGPLVQRILGSKPDGDSGELKQQLGSMLGDQFDAMSDEQKKQIDQLAERLNALKHQLEARAQARDEIIRRRMNELLRQPDPLAWDPNASRRNREVLGSASPDFGARNDLPIPPPIPPQTPAPSPPFPSIPGYRNDVPSDSRSDSSRFQPRQQQIETEERRISPAETPAFDNAESYSKYRIDSIVQDLYSAIGRFSVDESPLAKNQLDQSITAAQRMIRMLTKSGTSDEQLAPLVKAVESAAAQSRDSGADLEEGDKIEIPSDALVPRFDNQEVETNETQRPSVN